MFAFLPPSSVGVFGASCSMIVFFLLVYRYMHVKHWADIVVLDSLYMRISSTP